MKKIIVGFLLSICLIAGLLLVFNKQVSYYFVHQTSENYQISKIKKDKIKENSKKKESFNLDQIEPISSQAVVKSQMSQNKKDLPVIAGIAIPDVGINLPIFKGVTNENLLYGAGTLSPEQKMGKGNYALASHRMNNPSLLFTPLERVSIGDKIYLTDLTNVYIYKTTSKKQVKYTDTSALDEQSKKSIVTLITCSEMNSPNRIVVQGDLVKTEPIEETTIFT